MLDEETLVQWEEWSKRDDAWKLFVPSDLRQMLGEIRRLREIIKRLDGEMAEKIWITPDGQA